MAETSEMTTRMAMNPSRREARWLEIGLRSTCPLDMRASVGGRRWPSNGRWGTSSNLCNLPRCPGRIEIPLPIDRAAGSIWQPHGPPSSEPRGAGSCRSAGAERLPARREEPGFPPAADPEWASEVFGNVHRIPMVGDGPLSQAPLSAMRTEGVSVFLGRARRVGGCRRTRSIRACAGLAAPKGERERLLEAVRRGPHLQTMSVSRSQRTTSRNSCARASTRVWMTTSESRFLRVTRSPGFSWR